MQTNDRYPLGQQDFRILRERDCVYIDKTMYLHKIVDDGTQYFFLARPRRFGKSLFLSTIQYFFEGRRELFKGLYIDSTDWDWVPYPVLRLDLNRSRYRSKGELDEVYNNAFKKWEAEYGVTDIAMSYSARFENIIEAAHRKTGRQVVILVDEYDKPMVANINNQENIDHYREQLACVFSVVKCSNEHIRLAFVTSVSSYNRHSAFDGRNNLVDISFHEEYADICGFTEQEANTYLHQGISRLAEAQQIKHDSLIDELKLRYMGYRFSRNGNELYDPVSLLQALNDLKVINYLANSELSEDIAEILRRNNINFEIIVDIYYLQEELSDSNLISPNLIALLYQNGYLTIKSYNQKIKRYKLGIPNLDAKEFLYRTVNYKCVPTIPASPA